MSWKTVARKDIHDARRSRVLWARAVAFVLLAVVVAGDTTVSPLDLVRFVAITVVFVMADVSLFVGVSATTSSTTRAATVSVLRLVVFEVA